MVDTSKHAVRHSPEFKDRAIALGDEIGDNDAALKLNCSPRSISNWRHRREAVGLPTIRCVLCRTLIPVHGDAGSQSVRDAALSAHLKRCR